jgi:hypothetical protein
MADHKGSRIAVHSPPLARSLGLEPAAMDCSDRTAMSDGYRQTFVDKLRAECVVFGIGLPDGGHVTEFRRSGGARYAKGGWKLRHAVDNMGWRP